MRKPYFAYIRVSTVKQGQRGSSLVEQRSAIEAYATRHGLSIGRWFEEMETAAKQGRRAFSEMMSALKAGKASGLIVHKIDRSARNLRDWADLGELVDRGVDIRFANDNFDLLSRGGRLSADIQAVVAADYVRNLRDEVRKGIYGRLKQGIYPFRAPLGYCDRGKGAVKTIDPVKGPLVRTLFERYASGTVSLDTLGPEMFANGLGNLMGRPLPPNALSDILHNPFYAGVIRIKKNGQTFQGAHTPLIAKNIFDQVQAILAGKAVPKAKKHRYLFRQHVRCHVCGKRTLTGERQKGRVYYRCHGKQCDVSWREDRLERVVLAALDQIRFPAWGRGEVGELIRAEYGNVQARYVERQAAAKLQLQNLDSRISRMTDLLIDGSIDPDAFAAHKQRLLMERQGLLGVLQQKEDSDPVIQALDRFELQNGALLRYEILDGEEKRELLSILCSNFAADEENVVFTLHSPYREIAELPVLERSGHFRGDLRTFEAFDVIRKLAAKGACAENTSPSSPRPPHSRPDARAA